MTKASDTVNMRSHPQGDASGPSKGTAEDRAARHTADARRQWEKGKAEAARAVESVTQKGKHAVEDLRDQAQEIAAEARVFTTDAADKATQRTVSLLEQQKSTAASWVESVQNVLEDASGRLRADKNTRVADFTDLAASRLKRVSRHLEQHSLSELTADVENFARRRPEVVFGGLLVAGVAVARVLKSSSRRRRTTESTPNSYQT